MHPERDAHLPTPEDQFDAWLDAFVAGPSTPAPNASASTSSDPALDTAQAAARSAARQVHELAETVDRAETRVTAAIRPSPPTWEEILMTSTPTPLPVALPVALPTPIPSAAGHRSRARSSRMDAVNRLISIAAILALLIAGASTAWLNRDRLGFGSDGGGHDPGGVSYLAAITLPSGQTVQIAYEVPSKEDCTVEPLTVDQVMTKLRVIEPSLPLARAMSGTPPDSQAEMNALMPNAEQLDEKTFTAIKNTQVEWLACALFGSPFQRWALESNTLVQQEFQAAYFPVFDMGAIEADLKALEAGKDIGRFHAPVVSANGYLPMVLESWQGFIDPRDNSTNIFVLWMRADGQVLQPFSISADPSASEPYRRASYFEQNLPNVWTFRPGETTDTWLLDSFTIKLG